MPNPDATPRHIDRLAGVVMHVLIHEDARTTEAICRAVERDPNKPDERSEVEQALALLQTHELAVEQGEQWTATRAAIMADELSW